MSIIKIDFGINCRKLYEIIYGEPAPTPPTTAS